jgi:hypothetical protein
LGSIRPGIPPLARSARPLVEAEGLTDYDIDRLITQARKEVEPRHE